MQLAKPRITAWQFLRASMPEPNVDNTRVIMFAWPNGRITVELAEWIFSRYPRAKNNDNIGVLGIQGIVQARNTAIRDYVLKSDERYRWFLFADADVRPHGRTADVFNLSTDIRCCRVPTRNPNAWTKQDSFHDQFWLARREVFEQIPAPWFEFPYTADGCALKGCLCSSFRQKALAAGFTISHGGYAEHDSDNSWH